MYVKVVRNRATEISKNTKRDKWRSSWIPRIDQTLLEWNSSAPKKLQICRNFTFAICWLLAVLDRLIYEAGSKQRIPKLLRLTCNTTRVSTISSFPRSLQRMTKLSRIKQWDVNFRGQVGDEGRAVE